VGSDLTEELDLAAAQGTTRTHATAPIAIEAEELPHTVESETARLYRITQEMALEEPIVETHVARGGELPATARPADMIDSIQKARSSSCEKASRAMNSSCVIIALQSSPPKRAR
jgi:hypothetical protein